MAYNDGRVHLEIYDNNEDKVAIAKEFSEGDLLLENCLLQLWNSNIKTMACCKGHDGGRSYLSLIIDSNSHPLINAICEFLYVQEGNLQLHFSKNAQDYKVLNMYMSTEKEKNDLLEFICNFLNKEQHNEISTNNILFYAILLLNFAENHGLSCSYIIDKNGMKFKYGNINSCYMEGQESILLKDIIDYIKQTGNIPGALISCNPELLEQFINIIYPNLYQKAEDTLK